jgi:hypothetical protein
MWPDLVQGNSNVKGSDLGLRVHFEDLFIGGLYRGLIEGRPCNYRL